jgi:hypothetical protein
MQLNLTNLTLLLNIQPNFLRADYIDFVVWLSSWTYGAELFQLARD